MILVVLACTSTSSESIVGFDDAMPEWSLQSDMPLDASLSREGEPSFYHLKTGNASRTVNSMLEGVLYPLDGLRELEPEWEDEASNTVRFGPVQAEGEAVSRQLLITWPEDDSRLWEVQEDLGDGWVTVFEGAIDPGSTDDVNSGQVTAWFDRMHAPDNPGPQQGTFSADYVDDAGAAQVDSVLEGVEIDGELLSTEIRYMTIGDGSGNIDFRLADAAIVPGEKVEEALGHGRWLPEEAGRADVRVLGGDLGEGTVSECWGLSFQLVYSSNSWGEPADVGTPEDCPPGLEEAEVPPAPE